MVIDISRFGAAVLVGAALAATLPGPVAAQSIQAICGGEWQAAKTAGKVPAGTAWPKFLSECRARHANDAATQPVAPAAAPVAGGTAAAPATPPAPAPATAVSAPVPPKPVKVQSATTPPAVPAPASTTAVPTTPAPAPEQPNNTAAAPASSPQSPGREAMVARERQCGARWKVVKGTPGLPTGITTWPKYWSWCNARLKANQPI